MRSGEVGSQVKDCISNTAEENKGEDNHPEGPGGFIQLVMK
jgi:hypothetical protein